jgi:hypothetical protein
LPCLPHLINISQNICRVKTQQPRCQRAFGCGAGRRPSGLLKRQAPLPGPAFGFTALRCLPLSGPCRHRRLQSSPLRLRPGS